MDRVAGVDGPAWCCPSMADGQPASRRCPGRSAERRSEPRPNCRSRIRGAQRTRAGFTRAAQSVRYLTTNQGHPGSGADCDNTSGGAQEILASGCADPWLMTRRSVAPSWRPERCEPSGRWGATAGQGLRLRRFVSRRRGRMRLRRARGTPDSDWRSGSCGEGSRSGSAARRARRRALRAGPRGSSGLLPRARPRVRMRGQRPGHPWSARPRRRPPALPSTPRLPRARAHRCGRFPRTTRSSPRRPDSPAHTRPRAGRASGEQTLERH